MNIVLLATLAVFVPQERTSPDFSTHVAPILTKYCVGCHNQTERDGGLSLETWNELQAGGDNGAVVVPGGPESSRLLRVLVPGAKLKMPPDGEPAPTADEIRSLREWVAAGAVGPGGNAPRRRLVTPDIKPAVSDRPITALDHSPDGSLLAVGQFGQVSVLDAERKVPRWRVSGLPGKVNSVRFSADGRRLAVATGTTGLKGCALVYVARTGLLAGRYGRHRDTIYAAAFSPDRSLLATAGYDRTIRIWSLKDGSLQTSCRGHNGAVFDLDFSADGGTLASASADQTLKFWDVSNGRRLDTRSEPLAEQYVVRFSPDGRYVIGGGADSRIRVWEFVSRGRAAINPLVYSRFGHEAPVVAVDFSADGRRFVSAAEDRTVNLWNTSSFTPVSALPTQDDAVSALSVNPNGRTLTLARMDGVLKQFPIRDTVAAKAPSPDRVIVAQTKPDPDSSPVEVREAEPNDQPSAARLISVPAVVTGVIDAEGRRGDTDLFRFKARAGEEWVLEVRAARDKSPLDSHLAVLTPDGRSVPRVLLRAVRDSYFTFRGKDSDTSDDFRIHNWEEMELNDYLYANGEVSRLWHYPRGPDSGFRVYPGRGKRHGFFDTTPLAHALHQPCYVVEPFPPGTSFVANGLPVFTINFENDDESTRRMGRDSKLFFAAPDDGEYLIRLTDTRGFSGSDYSYKLEIRRPSPDFRVKLNGANPKINRGSGREFRVTAERLDGFDGPIRVDISGLPEGIQWTTPLIIQAGQDRAFGTINVSADAKLSEEAKDAKCVVTATAKIHGREVVRPVNSLGKVQIEARPRLQVLLTPPGKDPAKRRRGPWEMTIAPGETISARVVVKRNNFKSRVDFGKDDSGRNLPHGVYVDNIGLNGLMIVEGQTERAFFITAAPWVRETSRLFHLRANVDGGQTSLPLLLHVRQNKSRNMRSLKGE